MFYGIEMDHGEPVEYFSDLQLAFEALQRKGHIFVYNPGSKKYQTAAKNAGINANKYACYIETSIDEEGDFYESLSLWIEHQMGHTFGDPTLRPYIEAYLEREEEDEI